MHLLTSRAHALLDGRCQTLPAKIRLRLNGKGGILQVKMLTLCAVPLLSCNRQIAVWFRYIIRIKTWHLTKVKPQPPVRCRVPLLHDCYHALVDYPADHDVRVDTWHQTMDKPQWHWYADSFLQLLTMSFTCCSTGNVLTCHRVIVSMFHRVILSLCHCVLMSSYHCAIMSTCHCAIVLLCDCAIVSSCYCVMMSLCHYVIVKLCHCAIVPLCHCVIVSLCHCVIVPLCHCVGCDSRAGLKRESESVVHPRQSHIAANMANRGCLLFLHSLCLAFQRAAGESIGGLHFVGYVAGCARDGHLLHGDFPNFLHQPLHAVV
jgi:hypothetical protein